MAYKGMARISMRKRSYKSAPYQRGSLGRMMRRGLLSTAIAARLHTFKRVAQPLSLVDGAIGNLPTPGNAGTGNAYPWLKVANQIAGYTNGTLSYGGAMTFSLNQVANYAEITGLFDNYRIKKVILRFDYSANSAPGGVAGAVAYTIPLIHITPDFDDNSDPANREAVLQNSYTKTYRLDRSFSMALTPRAQTVIATGQQAGFPAATAVGGMLPQSTWLDCNSPQIPHFGVKFWVDDWTNVGVGTSGLRITPTYILEAKNVV